MDSIWLAPMTNQDAALRLGNISLKHTGMNFEALHRGMRALNAIDELRAERDRFKARAEAAEADMKRIADDMDGETDACYPCSICAKNNRECDTSDNCFKWRGPQEGANT